MGVVASAAVVLAAYSAIDRETGNPLLGLVIVVACTAGVAGLRIAEAIDRQRADGEPVTISRKPTAILASCGVAILIVGLADLAFLLGYGFLAGGAPLFSFSPTARHRYIVPDGLMAGAVAGLAVGYLSRWAFRQRIPSRGWIVRRLAPFAVVALLLGAVVTLKRIQDRLEKAGHHDVLASVYGGESSIRAPAPQLPGDHPRPEVAGYHVRMRRKWEQAAARPWLPVDPDPPLPTP